MPECKVYRDTPKRGETAAKWCAYVVEDDGHITRPGTTGHDTPEQAAHALGYVRAPSKSGAEWVLDGATQ